MQYLFYSALFPQRSRSFADQSCYANLNPKSFCVKKLTKFIALKFTQFLIAKSEFTICVFAVFGFIFRSILKDAWKSINWGRIKNITLKGKLYDLELAQRQVTDCYEVDESQTKLIRFDLIKKHDGVRDKITIAGRKSSYHGLSPRNSPWNRREHRPDNQQHKYSDRSKRNGYLNNNTVPCSDKLILYKIANTYPFFLAFWNEYLLLAEVAKYHFTFCVWIHTA